MPSYNIISHLVCVAASVRDVFRVAQYYTRDMSQADNSNKSDRAAPTLLSKLVAKFARSVDGLMSWSSATAVRVFLPSWRKLPSPFTPGMLAEVSNAIAKNSIVHNSLFNLYFFRAAVHIVQRYAEPPYLILEHRVDSARRSLAREKKSNDIARILMTVVENAPIARVGQSRGAVRIFENNEPNVAVFSIACVALLFAGEGKPSAIQNEDEFFAVVGALITPRLEKISSLIAAKDCDKLLAELNDIKAMY